MDNNKSVFYLGHLLPAGVGTKAVRNEHPRCEIRSKSTWADLS